MQTVGEVVGGPFRQFGPWEEFSKMSKVFSDLRMCFVSGRNARLHRRRWVHARAGAASRRWMAVKQNAGKSNNFELKAR